MNGKMKAAVFEGNGKMSIKQVGVPVIVGEDEVIVEVEACSICGTDVHIMEVPPAGFDVEPGLILGHELVGKVLAVGTGVRSLKKGDRVVAEPNDYCGVCENCLIGLTNHCLNQISLGVTIDGGFAEYVKITEKVAHKIPANMPANIAVFAEPLACVLNGIRKINVLPGQSALIIGAGPIGLIFVQMLKAAGASPVIVSEPSEFRRLSAEKCGADKTLDPRKEDIGTVIKNQTGLGADVVVDAVGSRLSECIQTVRNGGKVLAFGFNTKAEPTVVQHQIVLKEIEILGTWIARGTFPGAVEILDKGVLELEKLITHIMPLEEVVEGIDILSRGEGLEVIITPK